MSYLLLHFSSLVGVGQTMTWAWLWVSLFNRNVDKVKCHPSLYKGGCHEAFDIEDLVKIGQAVKGSP